MFPYLAHYNEENIPLVDNKKPTGLIHLYLSNIPFPHFAKKISSELRASRASPIRSFIEDMWLPKINRILLETDRAEKVSPYFDDVLTSRASEPEAVARGASSGSSNVRLKAYPP